ncbi:progestin and adipoQ receptor family member 4 [Micractinium conductrix]|uniref:Progestin and adipoQ receptor family member 4 n=1 Tax=Micractinium conductrix TaxID=554055 RepID=A0A2P6VQX7_9CHLO|nr:progestin and adipoQ receptor family member 4 [Micractinium conductrix]|eukprot:PSC76465.1 progestin and adipoQ receptor family member 4 [Micractinium conductrix]
MAVRLSQGWQAHTNGAGAAAQFAAATEPPPPPAQPPAAEWLRLVPKRKRGKAAGVERVDTMAAFAVECDCRSSSSPGATVAAGAAPAAAPTVTCAYYSAGCRRLYAWEDAPAALRFNEHIRTGYRAGYTYGQCCASVLGWHNETLNIWTHGGPLLLLLALLLGGQVEAWRGARWAFACNVGSIALCFALSVAYHSFMAHHHHHDNWLRLDMCGILLVLVGGGHMLVWWGLHCHPTLRLAFSVVYYSCGALCVRAALRARTAVARGMPMLALLAVRLSAFATRALLGPPGQALVHYAAMEACSLVGGTINVLRVPERWLQPADPLKAAPLDYFFNSHQIMHVLAAAAMWQLHLGASADYRTVAALQTGAASCPA